MFLDHVLSYLKLKAISLHIFIFFYNNHIRSVYQISISRSNVVPVTFINFKYYNVTLSIIFIVVIFHCILVGCCIF
jgi:hypothetical protein